MSMEKELKKALQQFRKRDVHTFSGKVVSVNKNNGSCVVDDGDMEHPDVRLSAVINENKDVYFLFPKVGSSVLVSPINEDLKTLYVDQYSEVEELNLNIGATAFKVNEKGFLLEKDTFNYGKLQDDFLTELMKVFTQNGLAHNPVKFEEFKLKSKTILNLNE